MKIYTWHHPIPDAVFGAAYKLLCASLPEEESRSYDGQLALFHNPHYQMRIMQNNAGDVVALLAVWEWEHIRYGEHFAVAPSLRGQGLGEKILRSYLQEKALPFVLEVEPAGSTLMAARRIGFYRRIGLTLNGYDYLQPPLRESAPWIPLQLMSWPDPISRKSFPELRDFLYRNVYGISAAPQ